MKTRWEKKDGYWDGKKKSVEKFEMDGWDDG
jgi:hypothetical protein